ncbi:Hypothetical predicted protein [Octopus vulgaris]|uniref:Uncharacterized protein n=1 Tax=Octopus vulgaris TaxID=6645 RepID=A0AA36EW75_OCTVU|nr:Hypothetical predicted protein [Octopus vulgaris]
MNIVKCVCCVEYRNQYTSGETVEAEEDGEHPWKISASTNSLAQGETPELIATSTLISGKQISTNRFLK